MGQGDEAAQHTSGEDRDPSTALLSHKCGPWRPPAHVTLWQPVPANCDRQEHQKFVWIYNSGRNHRWSSPGWVSHFLFIFLNNFLVPRFRSPSWVFTLCTIFGRMPGFEPELLRLQPGLLQRKLRLVVLYWNIISFCSRIVLKLNFRRFHCKKAWNYNFLILEKSKRLIHQSVPRKFYRRLQIIFYL